jgi:hypothetical protein
MVPQRGFIRQQVWTQILALNSKGGVYPRPLLFRCIGSNEVFPNIKFQYSMTKTGLVRRRRIGHCDLFDICDL